MNLVRSMTRPMARSAIQAILAVPETSPPPEPPQPEPPQPSDLDSNVAGLQVFLTDLGNDTIQLDMVGSVYDGETAIIDKADMDAGKPICIVPPGQVTGEWTIGRPGLWIAPEGSGLSVKQVFLREGVAFATGSSHSKTSSEDYWNITYREEATCAGWPDTEYAEITLQAGYIESRGVVFDGTQGFNIISDLGVTGDKLVVFVSYEPTRTEGGLYTLLDGNVKITYDPDARAADARGTFNETFDGQNNVVLDGSTLRRPSTPLGRRINILMTLDKSEPKKRVAVQIDDNPPEFYESNGTQNLISATATSVGANPPLTARFMEGIVHRVMVAAPTTVPDITNADARQMFFNINGTLTDPRLAQDNYNTLIDAYGTAADWAAGHSGTLNNGTWDTTIGTLVDNT